MGAAFGRPPWQVWFVLLRLLEALKRLGTLIIPNGHGILCNATKDKQPWELSRIFILLPPRLTTVAGHSVASGVFSNADFTNSEQLENPVQLFFSRLTFCCVALQYVLHIVLRFPCFR